MPLVNQYAEWSKGLKFGGIEMEEGPLAVTLLALDRLAEHAPAEQASEAQYVSALLVEVNKGPDASIGPWREVAREWSAFPAGLAASLAVWEYDHLRVGLSLPAVKWTDRKGDTINLGSLRRPVIIYFWSAGCGPCKGTIENLKRQAAGWGAGTDLVAVNCDEDRKEFDAAIRTLRPPGRQVFMAGQPQQARFKISGFPLVLIVDKQSRIVSRNAPAAQYSGILRKIRGEGGK